MYLDFLVLFDKKNPLKSRNLNDNLFIRDDKNQFEWFKVGYSSTMACRGIGRLDFQR